MATIVDTIELEDYEIETEDGWKPLTHIHKTIPYEVWVVETKDYSLKCADEHILFTKDYKQIFVKDLQIGTEIYTEKGLQQITSVYNTNEVEEMYDVTVESDMHSFYSNGILSHNSVVCRILLLHYVLFNTHKTCAILANKEKTAHKLMKEFKDSYMQLPIWMQQGVMEGGWNKGEVNFENGVCVVASSTSSNAIRSYSISLLMLDEFAFVPDNIASDFFKSVYPTISTGEKSKVIIVSCVPKDTMLLTDKGPQPISTLVPSEEIGTYIVPTYNSCGYEKMYGGAIIVNNGKQKTRQLHTTVMDVESTLIHKWWVTLQSGQTGYIETQKLERGDFMAIRYNTNIWGEGDNLNFNFIAKQTRNHSLSVETITEDWAYFFGLFIAEGCANLIYNKNKDIIGGQIYITCGDTEDICALMERIGLKYSCKDGLRHGIFSLAAVKLLESVGFDLQKKAPEKCIPDRLLQMSHPNIIAMLQGIFDGDGYSCRYEGRVGINLSSKLLLDQIRVLLLNLGIYGAYSYVHAKPTKLVKVRSHSYRLQLTGQQAKKFFDEVGFRFKRKQLKESFLNQKYTRDKNDVIPFSKKKLWGLREISIDHYKQVQQTGIFKGNYHKSNHFNRQTIEKFREQLNCIDHPVVREVLEMCRKDLLWVRILDIKEDFKQVFDLSLPDIDSDEWCHSVIYNGFVGHNTPNGMNHFYRMWQKAVRGESGYYPIKINWWEVPNRDEQFKRDTIANLQGGIIEWNQEYACAKGDKTYILVEDQKTGQQKEMTIENIYKELENEGKTNQVSDLQRTNEIFE